MSNLGLGMNLLSDIGAFTPPSPDQETDATNASVLELLNQAAQQRLAAQQTADTAQQDLQTAEAAPVEQISPLTAGLSSGLARIATTLGGGPDYSAQLQERLDKQSAAARSERSSNIKQLRDTYEKAAQAAAKAGDHEAEIKARVAIHKLDIKHGDELQQAQIEADKKAAELRFQNDKALEGVRHTNRLSELEAAAKLKPDKAKEVADSLEPAFNDASVTTEAVDDKGNPIVALDLGKFTDKDSRNAALAHAAKNGKVALMPKEFEQLKDIQNARTNVDNQLGSIETYLPQGPWQRLVAAPQMKFKQVLQSKDDIAAFNTWRTDAINMLRANQGGVGLRITNTEFNVAREGMPKITDTYEVARRKIEILHTMLAARENLILRKDWRKQTARAVAQARRELAALDQQSKSGKPAAAGGTVTLYKNGVPHNIPADKKDDAVKNYGYQEQP